MNWNIIIPLLVGLISAILGYLIGKISGSGSGRNGNVDVYKSRISKLEKDLATCKERKSLVHDSIVDYNPDDAKAVFGKKIKQDDLKIVEGIGPKIEELFHNHNVKTWGDLANCSVSKCQEVLNSGGDRFKIHKPETWPKQSQMAFVGDWQGLKDLQDRLDGGK